VARHSQLIRTFFKLSSLEGTQTSSNLFSSWQIIWYPPFRQFLSFVKYVLWFSCLACHWQKTHVKVIQLLLVLVYEIYEPICFPGLKHIWPKISFVFDIARKRKVKICRISLTCLPICGFQDMFLFPHLFEKKSSDSAQFVVTQRKLKTTLGDILKWRHPRNEWHPCVNFINV